MTAPEPVAYLTPEQSQRAALIRGRLRQRLTPAQYRRVAMAYGLDGGEPLALRAIAKVERCGHQRVDASIRAGLAKLRQDSVAVILWLDTYL